MRVEAILPASGPHQRKNDIVRAQSEASDWSCATVASVRGCPTLDGSVREVPDTCCHPHSGRDQDQSSAAVGPTSVCTPHLICEEPLGPAPVEAAGPQHCGPAHVGSGLDIPTMIKVHRAREANLRPAPGYFEAAAAAAAPAGAPCQPAGPEAPTPAMRAILVSWVAEVAEEFSLQPETLHLAVSLLDRFIAATAPAGVPRGVLQMLAVACVLVAAKQYEVSHPSVEALTAIAANCFTAQDLLRTERVLLDALDFAVDAPTAFTFLHLYAHGAAGLPPPVAAHAVFLLDLALLDYALLAFEPSLLAAAALALAVHTYGHPALAAAAAAISGHARADVRRAADCLLQLHAHAARPASPAVGDLVAPVVRKYSHTSWCCAALCPPLPGLDPEWLA